MAWKQLFSILKWSSLHVFLTLITWVILKSLKWCSLKIFTRWANVCRIRLSFHKWGFVVGLKWQTLSHILRGRWKKKLRYLKSNRNHMCDSLSDSVESRQLPFVSILMSCAAMAEAICEQQKTHPNACLLSSEFNQSILAEKKWLSKSQNVTQITYQHILQNMLWNSNHGLCSNCILNLRKDNNSKISSFPMTDKTLLYILYPNFFLYSDFLYFIHSLFFDPSFHVFVSFCCLPVFFHMVLCTSFFFFLLLTVRKLGVFLWSLSAWLFLNLNLKFWRKNLKIYYLFKKNHHQLHFMEIYT